MCRCVPFRFGSKIESKSYSRWSSASNSMRNTSTASRKQRSALKTTLMRNLLISQKCTYLASSTASAGGNSLKIGFCWNYFFTHTTTLSLSLLLLYTAHVHTRLVNITEFLKTTKVYESLSLSRIEGIETFNSRFGLLASGLKKKPYNILDHRKDDFEVDYEDFKQQLKDLEVLVYFFIIYCILVIVAAASLYGLVLWRTDISAESHFLHTKIWTVN